MNLILKELEKSSKYNDFIKNLENKKEPDSNIGLNWRSRSIDNSKMSRTNKKTNI